MNINALSHVLSIDPTTKTALIEPNVPMDHLMKATLKYGLISSVVMEFSGITVNGGFSGTEGKNSSYKYEYFNETINSIEMVLDNDEIVIVSDKNNSDLFHDAFDAVGTLRITILLKLQLISTKKYVKATYHLVKSIPQAIKKVKKETLNPALNYMNGILYSKKHGAVVTDSLIDDLSIGAEMQRFNNAKNLWYYLRVQEKFLKNVESVTQYIPLADYLFRYDRGKFWVGASAFNCFKLSFNALTRWFFDDFLHTRMLYKALHASGQFRSFIVQDLAFSYSTVEKFIDYTIEEFEIWPLWLCPLRQTRLSTLHSHSHETEADDKTPTPLLNIGLWGYGLKNPHEFVIRNRDLKNKLRDFGGMK